MCPIEKKLPLVLSEFLAVRSSTQMSFTCAWLLNNSRTNAIARGVRFGCINKYTKLAAIAGFSALLLFVN